MNTTQEILKSYTDQPSYIRRQKFSVWNDMLSEVIYYLDAGWDRDEAIAFVIVEFNSVIDESQKSEVIDYLIKKTA